MDLKPGVYPDVDFDDYAVWPALNYSKLKHFRKTPRHARWYFTHDEESRKYQDFGHVLHMALLEPQRFKEAGAVVAPKLDRRTREGKATWSHFEKMAAGRQIVTQEDMDKILGIKESVLQHATASEALYGEGVNELSIVWEDPETGILCKARIDRLCTIGSWPFVVDLKTTHKVASTHSWQMAVESYGYHEQAAHYLRGLSVLAPLDSGQRKFAWLVVETEPPFCVRVFEAEDAALGIGNDQIVRYLQTYAECEERNLWPGWPEGMDIAGLPAWVYKRFDLD